MKIGIFLAVALLSAKLAIAEGDVITKLTGVGCHTVGDICYAETSVTINGACGSTNQIRWYNNENTKNVLPQMINAMNNQYDVIVYIDNGCIGVFPTFSYFTVKY